MKRIWTNGCFDVLHIGHMRLFKYAKSLGDYLTVGIDSDKRVKKLKGPLRPINSEIFRKEMLLSIKWIDNVVVFDDESELDFLVSKLADKMVVGSDYIEKDVIGSSHCDVLFFEKIPDFSTTRIINEIRK
jgi:D-beta-D-heptose 7-phosphate kinase/D-beta-D-heptose 1-phosphate adenosyltransferase